MSRKSLVRFGSRVVLCAALVVPSAPVSAQDPLWMPSEAAPAAVTAWDAAQRADDPSIADTGFVELDGSLLRDVAPGEARTLKLDLFGEALDVEFAYFQHQMEHAIYTGRVPGGDGTFVIGIAPSGIGSAVVEYADKRFTLSYTGFGRIHGLHRHDVHAAHPHAPCGCGEESHWSASQTAEDRAILGRAARAEEAGIDVATDVDIGIFWSNQVTANRGGNTAVANTIATHIGVANQAHQQSGAGTDTNWRLVIAQNTNYDETSSVTDLTRFQAVGDGFMDEVHAVRAQFGADLMGLMLDSIGGGICGQAYGIMCTPSTSFKANAFCMTRWSCLGQHTLTHELGHLSGSAHDRANATCGAYSFSYGARTPSSQYRSIMAYSPGIRVNRWSGPSSTWNGQLLGDASNDNARSLRQAAAIVAAFFPRQIGGPPAVSGIAPSNVGNYRPTPQTVRLSGTDLGDVTEIDIGGTVYSGVIAAQTATTLDLRVPDGLPIGPNPVVVRNGAGSSSPVTLAVDGSHPSILVGPGLHQSTQTFAYELYTDAGWNGLYLLSAVGGGTALPGIVTFEIGGGSFANLVVVLGVSADAAGYASVPVTMPPGLPVPFTFHWEVMTTDPGVPLGLQAPLETSNALSVFTFQ